MLRNLTLALTTLAAPAMAQGQFDGTWSFLSAGQTDPFFILELDESTGTMQGAGLIMNGQGALTEGAVAVTAGASLETALQIELSFGGEQGATGILTVIDGTATLVLAGAATQGQFIPFGTAPAVATTAPTTTTTASTEQTCASMMTVQQDVILHATSTERIQIQAIYDQADSRYGQDLTLDRCSYLLTELSQIAGGTPAAEPSPLAPPPTTTGSSCDDVEPLVTAINARRLANGLTNLDTVQTILNEAGLGVDGVWSTGACELGASNLRDYLASIEAAPAGQSPIQSPIQTTTTNVVKDPTQPAPEISLTGMRQLEFQVEGVSEHLNMRSGPGTDFDVVYQLPFFARNMRIVGAGCSPSLDEDRFPTLSYASQVVELSPRWCEVEWNNTQGWVAAHFIRPM